MAKISETKILVIDDKTMFCDLMTDAISRQPGFSATGTSISNPGAIEKAFSSEHDIVLLDIDMPVFDPPAVIQTILSLQPAIRILVLASSIEMSDISNLFESGAVGFIHKKAGFREVLQAIRTVLLHKPYISSLIRQQFLMIPEVHAGDKPLDVLSLRQREILTLIARGKPMKEIAYTLNLSVSTVHLHRKNLTVKLGIDNVEDLKKYAIRKGLISTAPRSHSFPGDDDINV